MTRGLRGKVFGTFRQVTHWRPCTHVTLTGYPGQDESCPPLEWRWNVLVGYALKATHVNKLQRKKDTPRERGYTRVTEESLEGYALKDTPINGLQGKVSKVTR